MAKKAEDPKPSGRTFFTAFGTVRKVEDGSVVVDDVRLARSQHSRIEDGIAPGQRARLRIALQVETDDEGRENTTLWLERAQPVKAREKVETPAE